MWYTIIVVKGRETKIKEWLIIQWTLVLQKKIFEKYFKNPLTKFIKYDIIYTSKGDNPKKRKEEKNYGNYKSYKGKKHRIHYD